MTPTSVSSRRTSGRLIPITFDGPPSMPVMNQPPSPSSVNPPATPVGSPEHVGASVCSTRYGNQLLACGRKIDGYPPSRAPRSLWAMAETREVLSSVRDSCRRRWRWSAGTGREADQATNARGRQPNTNSTVQCRVAAQNDRQRKGYVLLGPRGSRLGHHTRRRATTVMAACHPQRNEQHRAALQHQSATAACPCRAIRSGTRLHLC